MENYLFISYSYKNRDEVMKAVSRLKQLEFRIWYDSSAKTDAAFTKDSGLRIENCSYFIAFMSSDYLASERCRDELNYAHDKGKPRLLIYMNEMQIPNALNNIPSIHKYAYQKEIDFYQKIIEVNGINVCRGSAEHMPDNTPASASVSAPHESVTPASVPKNERTHSGILADQNGKKKAVAALICCIVSFLLITSAPIASLILNIAAIVLASLSKHNGNNSGIRKFANIMGIIFLIISVPCVIISLVIDQALNGIDEIGSRGLSWIDTFFDYILGHVFG